MDDCSVGQRAGHLVDAKAAGMAAGTAGSTVCRTAEKMTDETMAAPSAAGMAEMMVEWTACRWAEQSAESTAVAKVVS